ncbi:MAG: hypothetical protein IT442_03195 [Phycisphaeraceae bacterium]|nr:hypothetical protein [Phycisphaeraceae bacterium]
MARPWVHGSGLVCRVALGLCVAGGTSSWAVTAVDAESAIAEPSETASSVAVEAAHVRARLISPQVALTPGQSVTLGIVLEMEPGWHTYWTNPGDAGLAASVTWDLPKGFEVGPVQWPTPRRIGEGAIMSYGYEGRVVLPVALGAPAEAPPGMVSLRAEVTYLACKEICLPGRVELRLDLPVVPLPSAAVVPENQKLIHEGIERLPVEVESPAVSATEDGKGKIWVVLSAGQLPAGATEVYFFPKRSDLLDHAAEQVAVRRGDTIVLELRKLAQRSGERVTRLRGVLSVGTSTLDATRPGRRGWWVDLPVESMAEQGDPGDRPAETPTPPPPPTVPMPRPPESPVPPGPVPAPAPPPMPPVEPPILQPPPAPEPPEPPATMPSEPPVPEPPEAQPPTTEPSEDQPERPAEPSPPGSNPDEGAAD